jgi:hypothetical protein
MITVLRHVDFSVSRKSFHCKEFLTRILHQFWRCAMGIITEDLRSQRALLDNTEFVRPTVSHEYTNQIVSGNESLSLSENCVIYRQLSSGKKVVKIIPFTNVDFFCLQTCKFKPLLTIGVSILVLAAVSGLCIYFIPIAGGLLDLSQTLPQVPSQISSFGAPVLFLIIGVILLLIYTIQSRVELVICTKSASNQIKMSASDHIKESLEKFVESIESQMRRI